MQGCFASSAMNRPVHMDSLAQLHQPSHRIRKIRHSNVPATNVNAPDVRAAIRVSPMETETKLFLAETAREATRLFLEERWNERRHRELMAVSWSAVAVAGFGSLLVLADLVARLTGH